MISQEKLIQSLLGYKDIQVNIISYLYTKSEKIIVRYEIKNTKTAWVHCLRRKCTATSITA